MAERLKALVSKTSIGETQSGVRISLSPQSTRQSLQGLWRFVVAREREIRTDCRSTRRARRVGSPAARNFLSDGEENFGAESPPYLTNLVNVFLFILQAKNKKNNCESRNYRSKTIHQWQQSHVFKRSDGTKNRSQKIKKPFA